MKDIQAIKQLPLPARLFLYVVVMPTVLSMIYYGLMASDVYISEAKFALRLNSNTPSVGLFESVLSSGSIETANEDAMIVSDFIYSRDMLIELDNKLAIRNHFESNEVDMFSRMDPEGSLEDFLDYYLGIIEIKIDSFTNIITLRVHAFEPNMAHSIAQTIITISEQLVNNLSNRIVEDSLQFARNEVDIAEARIRAASAAVTQFRSDTNSINPGEETSAVLRIITGLEAELATSRAKLFEVQNYMQNSSPQVQVLQGKVDSLAQQVEQERLRLSNNEDTNIDYARLIDNFEPLLLEQELATKQYASTLASMELARIEAQRKQRYLLPFVLPQIPDEAVEPKRLRAIFIIFIGLIIIYAIGGLVWAAIKDHMRL
jgi:capsular polysaccharide transport system permease protein